MRVYHSRSYREVREVYFLCTFGTWKIMSDFLYIFSADQYFHLFLELCLYAVIEFSAFDLFVIFHDVILQFVMVL